MLKTQVVRVLEIVAKIVGDPKVRIAVITKYSRMGDFFPCLNMRRDMCVDTCVCDHSPAEEEIGGLLGFPIRSQTPVHAAAKKLALQTAKKRLKSQEKQERTNVFEL